MLIGAKHPIKFENEFVVDLVHSPMPVVIYFKTVKFEKSFPVFIFLKMTKYFH